MSTPKDKLEKLRADLSIKYQEELSSVNAAWGKPPWSAVGKAHSSGFEVLMPILLEALEMASWYAEALERRCEFLGDL